MFLGIFINTSKQANNSSRVTDASSLFTHTKTELFSIFMGEGGPSELDLSNELGSSSVTSTRWIITSNN